MMNRRRFSFSLAAVAVVAAAIVAVIATTSGASTQNASQNVAAGSAISLKQTSLGQTLVDANGRTLYLFDGDKRNMSTLSVAGQAVWPPFTATSKPRASGGVAAARIGTIPATAGPAQITYNGHPLYYYVGDHSSGQTRGQGLNEFGALWYVLGPGGVAVTSAPSAPSSAATSGSGGGYPY
jgi:predicted lipoprotein with Yx(FWY)xxD motif